MWGISRITGAVGGRRLLIALGVLYLVASIVFPVTPVVSDRTIGGLTVSSMIIGVSSLILIVGGSRLPATDIRADLYDGIAGWCLRGFGVMLGILLLTALVGSLDKPIEGGLALTGLASVAGFGMGYQNAQAKTQALNAEDRRKEIEQYSRELVRYETIVETVNDGIIVLDEDDHFALVNDAYTQLVGYDQNKLLGSHMSLVAGDDDEELESMTKEVKRDLREGTADTNTYESTVETASGELREVESTVTPLESREDDMYDRIVVVRDITERNERERQLKEQNEQLDSFAGLLAHELRNPVQVGQIYSQQLSAADNPEVITYVSNAFDRIEDIIDILLILTKGRKAVSMGSSAHLATVARQAWDEADTAEATLDVTTNETIVVDGTYLRHLFRNLFENAVEHGQSDVTVTVGDLPTGYYVADNGPGIPVEDRETIFRSGYTTASENGGMGLGLTFVNEMADVYEWACDVTESDAGGARFEFKNVEMTDTDEPGI